jgi:hypothetical protein
MLRKYKFDIVVAGAGIAGISAAVKAGQMGVKVALIERYAFVGGMSTAGMVSPFMKHTAGGQPLVQGIFSALENEMASLGGMIDNGFYANAFRAASYKLLTENHVSLFLDTELVSVKKEHDTIQSLVVISSGIECEIAGDVFIDTTGDAQIIFNGGFPWVKGDEKTGNLQAMTLFFRMGGIDIKRAVAYTAAHKEDFFGWMDYNFDFSKILSVAGYFSFVKKRIEQEQLSPDVHYIFYTTLPESSEASFNTTNILGLDGSTSLGLTEAELAGRRQVYQVVDLLQTEIPGFEEAYLLETAVQVGVRETRRAIGDYAVTGDDIRTGRKFERPVARGCYGIDIHGQKNEHDTMEDLAEGEYYEVPVESLMVKQSDNLLVAGRCISSTREGHGALRIMPTSSATGEACGALAAIAVKQNVSIRQVQYPMLRKEIETNVTSV